MGDYYIYEGRLYSSDQLMHFKLGFIKPGHKWITRKKAPAGSKKNWIYTYANKAKTAVVQEHQANKYDELAAEMEAEIQEKYGDARTMSPALVEDYNKKKAALDYYRTQASKSREKSKKIDKQLNKAISNKVNETRLNDKVTAFLKHPFNKTEREKAIQKGKDAIAKALKQEVRNAKRSTKNFSTNQLTKEQRTEKEVKRQERIKSDKKAIREKAVEYRKKQSELEKLRNDPNRIKGLNIQNHDETRTESMSKTNPHYNDKVDAQLYKQNCSNCTIAYDMRQRGYDVEANPNTSNSNYSKYDSIEEIAELYSGNNKPVGATTNLTWDNNTKYTLSGFKGDGFSFKDSTTNAILQSAKEEHTVDEKYRTWEPYGTDVTRKAAAQHINNKTYLKNLEKEMLKGGNGARGVFQVEWSRDGYVRGAHSMAYEIYDGKVVIVDAQTNEKYKISDFYESTCCAGFMRLDNMQPTEDITKKVRNVS